MFCPSCGAETSEGLSYCKRCGAKLGAARGGDSRPKVMGMVWAVSLAVAVITLGGLLAVLGFVIEFGRDASNMVVGLFALLLLVVFGVDYLLARQLSRLLSFHLHGGGDGPRGQKVDAAAPPAQLEAPRPSAYGALEQTTRTLGDLEQATRTLGSAEQATRTLDPAPTEREPR